MCFPQLPLLETLARTRAPLVERKLSNTLLVAVQHLLETTGSLFDILLRLGLRPENTFVLGKAYSSNREVADQLRARGLSVDEGTLPKTPGGFHETFGHDVERLWDRALETLRGAGCTDVVILDDGGRCISAAPDEVRKLARVSGVEQTTSGLAHEHGSPGFRVIEVATSAAKTVLESPMISRAVLRRLPSLGMDVRCGVIGVGNIGRALAAHLLERGHHVGTFDREPERSSVFPEARHVDSLEQLVRESDVLFGCSGDDVFAGRPTLEWRKGRTTLVSCSSEDREFRSLLGGAAADGSLRQWSAVGLAVVDLGARRLEVLRGGFPLNFDGSSESVPAREIQLTRALLLGGVIQALLCGDALKMEGETGRMLDPGFQSRVAGQSVGVTTQSGREPALEPQDWESEDWIADRSGGMPEDTSAMRSALDLT